jgi:hypothetical protein
MCAEYGTLVYDLYTAVRDLFVANLQRKCRLYLKEIVLLQIDKAREGGPVGG